MLKRYIPFFLCLTLICQSVHGGTDNTGKDLFAFDQLPDLPDPVGVAGPFAGIHNDALIVGGGANFPDGRPWEGGKKAWHDKVYVLQKDEDGNFIWNKNVFKLPRPIGYGISITTENGILCAGGCDGEKCFRDVFLLKWEEGKISIEQMPPLPRPLAFMTGAKIGNVVYVAGGQESVKNASATKNFWSLDLSKKYSESEFEWKELPEWPGPARVVALSAVQNDG
nr:hypothetical protein [Synergistaceae bacterium]